MTWYVCWQGQIYLVRKIVYIKMMLFQKLKALQLTWLSTTISNLSFQVLYPAAFRFSFQIVLPHHIHIYKKYFIQFKGATVDLLGVIKV